MKLNCRVFFAGMSACVMPLWLSTQEHGQPPQDTVPRLAWQVSVSGEAAAVRRGRPGRRGTGHLPRIVRGLSEEAPTAKPC